MMSKFLYLDPISVELVAESCSTTHRRGRVAPLANRSGAATPGPESRSRSTSFPWSQSQLTTTRPAFSTRDKSSCFANT